DTGTPVQVLQSFPFYADLTKSDGPPSAVDDLTLANVQSIRYFKFSRRDYDFTNSEVPGTEIKSVIPDGGINGFNSFNFLAVSKAAPAQGQSADVVIGRGNDFADPNSPGPFPVFESTNAGIASSTSDITWSQIQTGDGWDGVNKFDST